MMHDRTAGYWNKAECDRKAKRLADQNALRDLLRIWAADRRPDGVSGGPFWYLIRVRAGDEWKTAIELRRWGIMAWCPRQRVVEKLARCKRKRIVRRVICPGYLFVQLAPFAGALLGVLSFRKQVLGFVGSGETPWQVRPCDISALRAQVAHFPSRKDGGDSLFMRGMMVMIKDGPFAGFEGAVERPDNARGRLTVDVDLFGRVTLVELELDQVAHLG